MSVAIVGRPTASSAPRATPDGPVRSPRRATSVRPAGSTARPLARGRSGFAVTGAAGRGATAVSDRPIADPEHLASHHHEDAEAHHRADDPELRATGPEADPEALDEPRPTAVDAARRRRPSSPRSPGVRCRGTHPRRPARAASGSASRRPRPGSRREPCREQDERMSRLDDPDLEPRPRTTSARCRRPRALLHSGISVTALVPPMSSWS